MPLIETQQPGTVGYHRIHASTSSSVDPSEHLEQYHIRGPWHTGIRLDGAWNATITDPFINGPLGDEAEYANPQQMQVGIDLVGAMDCHVSRPRITCANVGIRASTHPNGFPRCEGLHIDRGWLMHVNTGIELHGSPLGGWPTPWTTVTKPHIAFNQFAVRATNIAWLHLDGINCYGSHYSTGKWSIYLVGCKQVQITNCDFWTNWAGPGFFGGIVLDQCEDVEITGGSFVSSISLALHATASCRNVRTNGKVWDQLAAAGKVANYASA